jgi:CDP-diacylglycerol--serine O-phosphatidyltransferase
MVFTSKKIAKNKSHSKERQVHTLFSLLPNLVTISSLCLTLTAIRFSMDGDFIYATILLLVAGFMDGVDGRLARFLNTSSEFGAQLDSLIDFVNFGVVPGFVIYFWVNTYQDVKGFDWAMVLFFAICMVIRLARFNVDLNHKSNNPLLEKFFFKGIPAPVGAALAVLPLVLYFEFGDGFYTNPLIVITYVSVLAVFLASRVPTISIKKIPIRNEFAYVTLMILGSIIIGLIVKPWLTLAIIGISYAISIPFTIFYYIKIEISDRKKINNA